MQNYGIRNISFNSFVVSFNIFKLFTSIRFYNLGKIFGVLQRDGLEFLNFLFNYFFYKHLPIIIIALLIKSIIAVVIESNLQLYNQYTLNLFIFPQKGCDYQLFCEIFEAFPWHYSRWFLCWIEDMTKGLFIWSELSQLTGLSHLAGQVFTPRLYKVFLSRLTGLEIICLHNVQITIHNKYSNTINTIHNKYNTINTIQ